jgi:N-ethylmaleimide reductase
MSYTPDGPKDSLTPRALSAAEIATTIGTYRQAAANALRAGFDGLEIHAQVSHLVAQFLNPRLNRRTDAYGGTSEKRAQFLLDIVDAVTSVWGSDRIGIKLSPYWNHGPAFTADAETLDEYDQLLKRLNDGNLAYLHLLGPEPDTGTDTLTAFARYRAHYHGAVIANLGFTQARGNALLERQLADAVSFGAPFIANPDLVDRFTHGHPLAAGNPDTHFAGGAKGYTDYPTAIGSY